MPDSRCELVKGRCDETSSGREVLAGGLGSVDPLPSKGGNGESTRIRSGNLFAKLSAVYAGGERSCESGHLDRKSVV